MKESASTIATAQDALALRRFSSAVSEDLGALALLHDAEPDGELVASLRDEGFPASLGLKLNSEAGAQAMSLMARAISEMPVPLDSGAADELAADYADIYLIQSLRASPYESVWLDEEQLERQQPMFEVRECYRRHGLAAGDWRNRADDHIVLQLQFLAILFGTEKSPVSSARLVEAARFMDEHLLRWLGQFCERVEARCATPFFAGVAALTGAYCEELREVLVRILDEPRPSAEAIEARMRPRRVTRVEVAMPYVPGMGPTI